MFLELIVDANVLFSALLAGKLSRGLLFNSNLKLYAPEYLLSELGEHLEHDAELQEKLRQTKEETRKVLQELQNNVEIIPLSEYRHLIKKAIEISPDEYDAPYLALALHLSVPVWSNDKKLKQQTEVEIFNTQEVLGLLIKAQ